MNDVRHQTPPDARLAASLLLLRDGDQGLELLMLRRAERDGDMRSGVWGSLDEDDQALATVFQSDDDPDADPPERAKRKKHQPEGRAKAATELDPQT